MVNKNKTNAEAKSIATLKGMEDEWHTLSLFPLEYLSPLFKRTVSVGETGNILFKPMS